MACDRFVRFKTRRPTRDDVRLILSNYFGGCGTITEDKPGWWMIVVPGTATSPFDGVKDGLRLAVPGGNLKRWIEVVYEGRDLDVLTRVQDEFTNGIADQLARAFARFYGAKLDMD